MLAAQASITPGKDAGLILDASCINVTLLNHAAGAIVTLTDRSIVSGVLAAGKVKKWKEELVDVDVARLTH